MSFCNTKLLLMINCCGIRGMINTLLKTLKSLVEVKQYYFPSISQCLKNSFCCEMRSSKYILVLLVCVLFSLYSKKNKKLLNTCKIKMVFQSLKKKDHNLNFKQKIPLCYLKWNNYYCCCCYFAYLVSMEISCFDL